MKIRTKEAQEEISSKITASGITTDSFDIDLLIPFMMRKDSTLKFTSGDMILKTSNEFKKLLEAAHKELFSKDSSKVNEVKAVISKDAWNLNFFKRIEPLYLKFRKDIEKEYAEWESEQIKNLEKVFKSSSN